MKTTFYFILLISVTSAWAGGEKPSPKDLNPSEVRDFVYTNVWAGREAELAKMPGFPYTLQDIQKADEAGIELKISPQMISTIGTWPAAMIPSMNMRLNMYEATLAQPEITEAYPSSHSVLGKAVLSPDGSSLRDYFLKPEVTLTYDDKGKEIANLDESLDIREVNPEVATSMAQAKSQLLALCATKNVFRAQKCSKILAEIVDFMMPKLRKSAAQLKRKVYITASPVFDRIMKNPKIYREAMRIAAGKVIVQVDSRKVTSHFLDDIYDSFYSIVQSEKEATDLTWDIIAIFASRGQNIMSEMKEYADSESYALFASLQVFFSGAAVLDSLSLASGNPYGLPKNVRATGDFGKFYHFWMTAFLTRSFGLKYNDPQAAMIAAQLANIGYEMRSNTLGRDPNRPLTVDTFESGNNKIRFDLSLAAAGAAFGASVAMNKNVEEINVDEGLLRLLRGAKVMDPVSADEAKKLFSGSGLKGYMRWNKIFSPKSILKYHQKNLRN